MTLSGSLSDWSVSDLLSMFKVTRKTGTLELTGSRPGSIHFREGQVVSAQVATGVDSRPDLGRTAATDALFMLAAADEGTFAMGPYQGPEGSGWEVEDLIADMSRLQSLERDVTDAGLTAAPLMLKDEVESPVTVPTEDWWAIASLVSVLSLAQLEEVFGRARAIRLLHTLWRLGVIESIDDHAQVEDVAVEDQPPAEVTAEVELVDEASRDEESWLDEIASTAGEAMMEPVSIEERRNLRGLSAPASTTLTGPVLDDMRRLRGHAGE
jgi:hypothetical protein